MVTLWSTFANVLLPPAIVLLCLLSLPFPRVIDQSIVRFVELIFTIKIGDIPVFNAVTFIAFAALVGTAVEINSKYPDSSKEHTAHDFTINLRMKASRWRGERNFWIAAFTFTVYWMLLRYHAFKKQFLKQLDISRTTNEDAPLNESEHSPMNENEHEHEHEHEHKDEHEHEHEHGHKDEHEHEHEHGHKDEHEHEHKDEQLNQVRNSKDVVNPVVHSNSDKLTTSVSTDDIDSVHTINEPKNLEAKKKD